MALWTDLATWRGPTVNQGGRMVEQRGVVVHIAEGTFEGTIAWQKNPAADVSSHFVVDFDGAIAQVVDTDIAAWTQAAGNGHWLSIENAGFHTGQLTAAQVEANAQILARAYREYGVPLQLAGSPSGYGLGWHGMGGAAWGGHPNCLPLDITEVLTPIGWVPLGSVTPETEVASVSADSGILSFSRPLGIVEPYEADTVSVADFEMTADHRLYVHRSDHPSRKVLAASDIGRSRTNWLVPCFGELGATAGAGVGPDLMRLLVWVQADGHYENDGGRLPILHFHVRKARKVERITHILDRLGVTAKVAARSDGTTSIRIRDRKWLQENVIRWLPAKRWEPWLLQADAEEFAAFDEEVSLADGSEHGGQRFYYTTVRENADLVQALYVTHGRAATVYQPNPQWVVNLHTRRRAVSLRDRYRAQERRGVLVGCLTTANDTILIRQRGRVVVVGNCPGPANVALLPAILQRAIEIVNGVPPEEDEMNLFTVHDPSTGTVWLCDFMSRRGVSSPAEWTRLQQWGIEHKGDLPSTEGIGWYGYDITAGQPVTWTPTPAELAAITEAARAGAEAGAPTHAELVAAAQEGAERAEDS